MAEPLYLTDPFEIVTCCHKGCGISFAMQKSTITLQKRHGRSFYCPNGHSQHWLGESYEEKAERLQRELDETRAWSNRRIAQEQRSHAATRGHLTRVKKRSAHGVCPCCKRTFAKVADHMKRMHPDYVEENG